MRNYEISFYGLYVVIESSISEKSDKATAISHSTFTGTIKLKVLPKLYCCSISKLDLWKHKAQDILHV